VGNGANVRIWGDRWINSTPTHMIQDTVQILPITAKVEELINLQENWCNIPLFKHIFSPATVENICSMAICPHLLQDRLVWAGTPTGDFSVKSAYHLDVRRRSSSVPSTSVSGIPSPIWSAIWSLQVPKYVQSFLWRACRDLLPTRDKLLRRKIVQDPFCPMCGTEAETPGHLLWWCDSARVVWAEGCRRLQKCSSLTGSFFSIFEYLSGLLDQSELEWFGVVSHKLWARRNQVVFGGEVWHPRCLLKSANEGLEDFRASQAVHVLPSRGIGELHVTWSPPPCNGFKINWDAAVDRRKKLIGIGLVARDHLGGVRGVMCSTVAYISYSTLAEALAARKGVELARTLGIRSFTLEGDFMVTVEALKKSDFSSCVYGGVVCGIISHLSDFELLDFSFVHKVVIV
jgi:hypothetical protein